MLLGLLILMSGCQSTSTPIKRNQQTNNNVMNVAQQEKDTEESRLRTIRLKEKKRLDRIKSSIIKVVSNSNRDLSIIELFDFKKSVSESVKEYKKRRNKVKSTPYLVKTLTTKPVINDQRLYFNLKLTKPTAAESYQGQVNGTQPLYYAQLQRDKRLNHMSEFGTVFELDKSSLKYYKDKITLKEYNGSLVLSVPNHLIKEANQQFSVLLGVSFPDVDNPRYFREINTQNKLRTVISTFNYIALYDQHNDFVVGFLSN